jgi:DNA end-binding protein Ku
LTLLEAFETPDFSLAEYKDHYVEELTKLIEAKVEGKEIVAPPAREEPRVINLMDALKKSVAAAKGGGKGEKRAAAPKKAAKRHEYAPRAARRKRKTG